MVFNFQGIRKYFDMEEHDILKEVNVYWNYTFVKKCLFMLKNTFECTNCLCACIYRYGLAKLSLLYNSWSLLLIPFSLSQVSSGNAISGNMAGHMSNRSVRPVNVVGIQRMPAQAMQAYNLASQAGMGGGMNPGIPMPRGVGPAHQQQVQCFVFLSFSCVELFFGVVLVLFWFLMIWCSLWLFSQQLRRKDGGMMMPGYPQQKSRRNWGNVESVGVAMNFCVSLKQHIYFFKIEFYNK